MPARLSSGASVDELAGSPIPVDEIIPGVMMRYACIIQAISMRRPCQADAPLGTESRSLCPYLPWEVLPTSDCGSSVTEGASENRPLAKGATP